MLTLSKNSRKQSGEHISSSSQDSTTVATVMRRKESMDSPKTRGSATECNLFGYWPIKPTFRLGVGEFFFKQFDDETSHDPSDDDDPASVVSMHSMETFKIEMLAAFEQFYI